MEIKSRQDSHFIIYLTKLKDVHVTPVMVKNTLNVQNQSAEDNIFMSVKIVEDRVKQIAQLAKVLVD